MSRIPIITFTCALSAAVSACDRATPPELLSDESWQVAHTKASNTLALDGGYGAATQPVDVKRDNNTDLVVASGTNAYTVTVALVNTKVEADKTDGSLCTFDANASSETVRSTLRSQLTLGTVTWTLNMSIDKQATASGVESKNHLLSVRQGSATPLLRIAPNNQGVGHWPVVTATTDGNSRVFTFHAAVLDASDPLGYKGTNVDVVIRLGTSARDPVAHMTCPLLDAVTATLTPSS